MGKTKIAILPKPLWLLKSHHSFLEFMIIATGSFFIPFWLAHPQMLVGIIVNILLVRAALILDYKKILPIIFLPSLGVISRGLVFGGFTPFLFYLLPFIFLGNFILIYFVKKLRHSHILWKTFFPAFLKSLCIASGAYVFIKLAILPAVLLSAMSLWQFIDAGLALIIVYTLVSLDNIWQSGNSK